MKSILTLLILLLAWAPVATADNILAGNGFLHGAQEPPPGYAFTFVVGNFKPYFNVTTFAYPEGGLVLCTPCDDPTMLSGLLFDHGIGHNAYGYYDGDILFFSSFSKSTLLSNGLLRVDYKSDARIMFRMCADSGCSGFTGKTYLWHGPAWNVQAFFKPDPNGGYDFLHATFFGIVPEPSTFFLLGTGLFSVLVAARRKLLG